MTIFNRLTAPLLMVATFASAANAETLKIALTGPFSGGSASMGVSMRDGAKLAIKEINDKGGLTLGGKKYTIEVIERDDEGKNERGALISQELSSMNDVHAVVGTANTGVVLAGDKNYQNAKKVRIICPAAGTASMSQWTKDENKTDELYIFRFAPDDRIQAAMVVEEAAKTMKAKKVAIIHDDTNYGVSGLKDLEAELKKYPETKVVVTEKFKIGDKDMSAQITKAKEAGAEAVLIWGIGPELAAVAGAIKKLDMKAPLIGGWTLSMSSFLDTAGKDADIGRMPQSFIEEGYSETAKKFINDYHTTYNVKAMPSPMSAAQGYDAIKVLAAAFVQAGSTDSKAVKNALEDLKEPVHGVITTWKKPYSTWKKDGTQDAHEAFRREHVVMANIKDGKAIFGHDADRKRLQAASK